MQMTVLRILPFRRSSVTAVPTIRLTSTGRTRVSGWSANKADCCYTGTAYIIFPHSFLTTCTGIEMVHELESILVYKPCSLRWLNWLLAPSILRLYSTISRMSTVEKHDILIAKLLRYLLPCSTLLNLDHTSHQRPMRRPGKCQSLHASLLLYSPSAFLFVTSYCALRLYILCCDTPGTRTATSAFERFRLNFGIVWDHI